MQGRLETEMKKQEKINKMLNSLPKYVTEWFMNLKASRKTIASCIDYVQKIKKFLTYINNEPINVEPKDITLQAVESYMIASQTKRNRNGMIEYTSDSHQIAVWCALNSFLTFLYNRKYIDEIYTENIDKPKNKDLDRINENRVLLTQNDFKKIIRVIQKGEVKGKKFQALLKNRDLLIVSLFMSTGMRETALLQINISDFDLKKNKLIIVDKGNKTHSYPLNEQIINLYTQWLEDRENIVNKNEDALFINTSGERLTSSGIIKIIKRYTKAALGKELSPHKLRAGFCSILYDKTHDAEFVRRAVGHSNVNTTQRYIRTNNDERKKASEIINDIISI